MYKDLGTLEACRALGPKNEETFSVAEGQRLGGGGGRGETCSL